MPLMEQLGLLEDLKKISKVIEHTTIFKENMEVMKEVRLKDNKSLLMINFFFLFSLFKGALNAMLDAVILANAIFEMPSSSFKHIGSAFNEYYQERFPTMTSELASSQQMGKVMAGQSRFDTITRHILLNYVPKWFKEKNLEYTASYRPQATFLPMVENRGTLPVKAQKKSKKYAKIISMSE
ncbi:hypothetical protein KVV02_005923 [Mortierella alpina]|uniref:Uncharacterized protein n=1 Tax=Mortierella alpina TaxID=64518 RepID=A0A9P7ZWR3_MORAP|nr:hypothetical protein KVV02_005923 [Mortierella alpina]